MPCVLCRYQNVIMRMKRKNIMLKMESCIMMEVNKDQYIISIVYDCLSNQQILAVEMWIASASLCLMSTRSYCCTQT